MIRNKVLEELNEHLTKIIELVIKAEEEDPDFNMIREVAEQLASELEALED